MTRAEKPPKPAKSSVCDCCRIRRIKCDGLEPCWRCITSGLKCTFSAARKRGPRGNGSAVLAWLKQRQSQESPDTSSSSALVGPSGSNSPGMTWDSLPMEVIRSLIDAYFQYINPIVPIMNRNDVIQFLKEPPTEVTYALVAAMTAVPLKRVNALQQKYLKSGLHETLIDEAVKTKNSLAYIREKSVLSVKVSFFLYLCFCATEDYDMAYYYLNESAMLARLLKLDDERSYRGLSEEEAFSRRILYWGLYISDRGFSIHERTPVIMTRKIRLPSLPKDRTDADQFTEFLTLVKVMVAMDDSFMEAWVSADGISPTQFSSFYLPRIQQSLVGALTHAPERYESGIQKSNVLITQPWLLLLLWKTSTDWPNQGSGVKTHETNYLFPTMVAQIASEVTRSVTIQDLLSHGPGMRKKLFDIGASLAETVTFMPELNFEGNYDRKQILNHIMSVSKQLGDTQSAEYKHLSRQVKGAIQELDTAGSSWIYSQTTVRNDAANSDSDDARAKSDRFNEELPSPTGSMFGTAGSVTSTEERLSVHSSSLETHSAASEVDYERNFLTPDSIAPMGVFLDAPQTTPVTAASALSAPPPVSQAAEIPFYQQQAPTTPPIVPPAAQSLYYSAYTENASQSFSPIDSAVLEGSPTQLAESYGYRPA